MRDFLNGGAWEIAGEFVEVESGKRADRSELARALEACRMQTAKLVLPSWTGFPTTSPSSLR